MRSPRKPLATRNIRSQELNYDDPKGNKMKKPDTRMHTHEGDTSHTHAGNTLRGSLKDGSRLDQDPEDRHGLHLGDDYRIDRVTGEQNEDVRRQTGTANHLGGKSNGIGGGKSSGSQGHGVQSWMQQARNTVRQQSKIANSKKRFRS